VPTAGNMSTSQINPNQLRPPPDDGPGQIIKVGVNRRAEAIERLVGSTSHADRDHARRFLEYAHSHRINMENLWAQVNRHGRITSAVLAVPSPGRTAMVFATHADGVDDIKNLARLIDHACRRLPEVNVNLAQVLLEPGEHLEHEVFLAAGFEDLATLSYLERPVQTSRAVPPPPVWPAGVSPVSYQPSMHDELVDVLDKTYEQTLDCPGLRGHRKTRDIVEGHRAAGDFDPALWTILRKDGKAVGALLLNPSIDHQSIELVYLGLSPSMRGIGLGKQLLRHGLSLVHGRSERTINLAVDEHNKPAIALYKSEGFRPALRRLAMIRPLAAHTPMA
jgi:ribosomal protein S18 acetylase RimI-like enzyme